MPSTDFWAVLSLGLVYCAAGLFTALQKDDHHILIRAIGLTLFICGTIIVIGICIPVLNAGLIFANIILIITGMILCTIASWLGIDDKASWIKIFASLVILFIGLVFAMAGLDPIVSSLMSNLK